MSRYVDNKYYHVSSLHLVMGNVWCKGIALDSLPIIILKSGYMKIKTARSSAVCSLHHVLAPSRPVASTLTSNREKTILNFYIISPEKNKKAANEHGE